MSGKFERIAKLRDVSGRLRALGHLKRQLAGQSFEGADLAGAPIADWAVRSFISTHSDEPPLEPE
jgi:hypothetical protein